MLSPALYIAGTKLLLHLLTANRYGIFRDELYYLACAEHLDWGYVDQPPLIALIAWIVRHTLGTSLFAIRILPALAHVSLVAARTSRAIHLARASAEGAGVAVRHPFRNKKMLTSLGEDGRVGFGRCWTEHRARGRGSVWENGEQAERRRRGTDDDRSAGEAR